MSTKQQYGPWKVINPDVNNLKYTNGRVHFVENVNENNDDFYVIKVKHETKHTVDEFIQEIEIAAQMDHPNIIKTVDYSTDPAEPWLVTEYVKGGALQNVEFREWTYQERLVCFEQITKAKEHIANKGYVKTDNGLHNILVKEDGKTPVLCDFERACELHGGDGFLQMLLSSGMEFYNLIVGERWDIKLTKEKQINEEMDELQARMAELEAEKAELMNT